VYATVFVIVIILSECWLVFAGRIIDYIMKKSGTVINHFKSRNTQQEQQNKKECKAPNELSLGRQNSAGRKVEDR